MKEKAKNKNQESKKGFFFTAEIFGIALVLFSALCLLCLLTYDLIFWNIGIVVSRFLLGVFGYFAFPVLCLLAFLGLKALLGFKVKNTTVKKVLRYTIFYMLFIGLILHAALTNLSLPTFGEYIKSCYQSGISLSQTSVGGAFLGIICYPVATLITPVGSYVFYSLVLALGTLYLSRHKIGEMMNEKAQAKAQTAEKDEKQSVKGKKVLPLNLGKGDSEQEDESALTDFSAEESQPERKKNVIFGGGEFELKNPNDKNQEPSKGLRVLFDERDGVRGGFTNGREERTNPLFSPVESNRSYRESYDRDLERKTQFVRTPYKTTGAPTVNSPMGRGSRSEMPDYYSTEEHEDMHIDVSKPENNVYVVRGNAKEREGISAFERQASGGRDSDRFSSSQDDYNRDRFSSSQEDYNRDRFSSSQEDYNRDRFSSSQGGYSDNAFTSNREEFSSREQDARDNYERGRSAERSADFIANREGFSSNEQFGGDRVNNSSSFESQPRTAQGENNERSLFDRERSTSLTEENLNNGDFESLNSSRAENTPNGTYDDFSSNEEVASYDETFGGGGSFFIEAGKKRTKNHLMRDQAHRVSEPNVASERPMYKPTLNQPAQSSSQSTGGSQISMSDIPKENMLINPIDNIPRSYRYSFPPISLLRDYLPNEKEVLRNKEEQSRRSDVILSTLAQTNIEAKIEEIRFGPTITRFELSIPINVQVKRVNERYEDLNLWLASREKIRLITPIQGTTRIGIEVPNSSPGTVGLKSIIESKEFKNAKKGGMTFALGKDVIGTPVTLDIATMPHLLVAGATGTGKSVFLNTLLISLIYKYSPEELRIILVDPKKVELSKFRGMPNLMFNEIFTDNAKVCSMLEWAVQEMEERYKILEESGQKNVNEYNEFVGPRGKKMFKILIIIDEFADLMNSSSERKLMENKISRLAAKSRAAGIHLIMATQRPSADIMEGSIKTNFVSRIAFKSASGTDSQVILGEVGAEKLLSRGDMLFKMGNMPATERAQGCFIDTPEIDAVCQYVKDNNQCYYDEFALEKIIKGVQEEESADSVQTTSSGGGEGGHAGGRVDEELVKDAMRYAITINNLSISGMQRKFGLGFPKAGKLMDVLIERGYVSPIAEGKNRKIFMTKENFEEIFGEPF